VASLFKSTGAISRHFCRIGTPKRAFLQSRRRYDDAMTAPAIRPAGVDDLDALAPLFDAYRRFYEQPGDVALASAFLHDRLERGDSTILVAEEAGQLMGFCQLYPSWCSVAAGRIFVLYDLFVDPDARRAGVARALMRAAQAFARRAGAVRLDLTTARTNTRAQALYESEGWQLDDVFLSYNLALASDPQTP
jgi:ribosomal protein S18 acetylase RimI-like enzyme